MSGIMFLIEEACREEYVERRRKRRRLREKFFLQTLPDIHFFNNYRLSKEMFETLCTELIPLLPPTLKKHGIDPKIKILTALNFYARGSYQGSVGQNLDGPMSQQAVSCCIRDVTAALNNPSILKKYIKFPQNSQDRNRIKRRFYDLYKMPRVVGCIDCTHVAIVRPKENEERFFNRKHFHSLNAQVICDSECYITNVHASYGGATHDAFIWPHCEIKQHMENLHNETTYLLGDSGYPVRKYLMIPIDNAVDASPEGRYNALQKRIRSTIERTFGILKGRWRCLLAARQLHYCPETAGKIILACCVLHNICIQGGIENFELTEEESREEHIQQVSEPSSQTTASSLALQQGQRQRLDLIELLERNR